MNSALSIRRTFSCALDSFLEIASCLFLPHLSNLTVRNGFTEVLLNTCSRYIESRENSKLLEEIQEPLWAYLRHTRLFWLEIAMLASVRSLRKELLASLLQMK